MRVVAGNTRLTSPIVSASAAAILRPDGSRFQSISGKTQTLPLAIYDHVQANAMPEANALSLIAVGTVLVILLVVGRLARVRY